MDEENETLESQPEYDTDIFYVMVHTTADGEKSGYLSPLWEVVLHATSEFSLVPGEVCEQPQYMLKPHTEVMLQDAGTLNFYAVRYVTGAEH